MTTGHGKQDPAVGTLDEPTTLSARAARRLAIGPLDPVTLMRDVCRIDRLHAAAAERMAIALLGSRPEFVRLPDGCWMLRDPSLLSQYKAPVKNDTELPDVALADMSFAVVDVETTGTRASTGDRITEIAIVRVAGGAVTDVYSRLVNPERPIPSFITALTHITWAMVADQPPFRHLADDVALRLTGHVFTAHNATFDWRFVSEELSRSAGRRLYGQKLCTVRLSRALLPALSRRSLDHVTRYFGIDVAARHRAEGDAVATAEVLLRLLRVAADRDVTTWSALAALVGERATPRERTASDRRRRAFPHPVSKDDVA